MSGTIGRLLAGCLVVLVAACGSSTGTATTAAPATSTTTVPPTSTTTVPSLGTITGWAHAGPVCPVQKEPPDPACADRPVIARIRVVADDGTELLTIVSNGDGTFRADVPPGTYTLAPQPVEGLMGTPGEQDVTVTSGGTTEVDIAYDTGIR